MYGHFEADELQYGFLSGRGCQKALFTLQNVVDYNTARGSPIYLAALDGQKRSIGSTIMVFFVNL